jgi:hypothetical protein
MINSIVLGYSLPIIVSIRRGATVNPKVYPLLKEKKFLPFSKNLGCRHLAKERNDENHLALNFTPCALVASVHPIRSLARGEKDIQKSIKWFTILILE